MNFRDIINHQQFNLPYNPSGGSLIPNRENFAPRTNIEKNRFVYTNPNSCYYNNYSRRTSKDFTNGVSHTPIQSNYEKIFPQNQHPQHGSIRKNSFTFNSNTNLYNNYLTNNPKEDPFQKKKFNYSKRLSFSGPVGQSGIQILGDRDKIPPVVSCDSLSKNSNNSLNDYLQGHLIHDSHSQTQPTKEGKLLMKNILKVDPTNKNSIKQNKINQFKTKLNSLDISPYASTQVDDSISSQCTTPNFEIVNLSDQGQTPTLNKISDFRRDKEKHKTHELKKTCKIESFLNPLLFSQEEPEDETPLLELDLKTPEGIFKLKISKTDNIIKTTKDFCIKNMIEEKFAEPITHLISKAIDSLDKVLNSQLNKENIEKLSKLCKLSKIIDTDEEGSTTLSENMSYLTVYDNNIESEDYNQMLNKTM